MSLTLKRCAAPAFAAVVVVAAAGLAQAAGPFGVGLPEPAPSGGGFLPGLFAEIAAWQSSFYRDLTASVRAMKTDGTAALWLCALAFAYGVVHALGPGHGKAIVSAYVLANRETARNGAVLSLVSAFAQAVTAVALVTIAALLLGATSMAMTRAAELFEIGSFALLTALGAWLVWKKLLRPLAASFEARYAPVSVGGALAAAGHHHGAHDNHHGHHHHHDDHGHDHHHHDHDHHDHDGCGHAHAAPLDLASGTLDWRKAWSTVVAVGMRPCTGALIVLVFSLSQGLYAAGIAATFAMALGTGLTVAALTLAAVTARGMALKATGSGTAGLRLHAAIEATGAVVILAFGLLMLGASLV